MYVHVFVHVCIKEDLGKEQRTETTCTLIYRGIVLYWCMQCDHSVIKAKPLIFINCICHWQILKYSVFTFNIISMIKFCICLSMFSALQNYWAIHTIISKGPAANRFSGLPETERASLKEAAIEGDKQSGWSVRQNNKYRTSPYTHCHRPLIQGLKWREASNGHTQKHAHNVSVI